MNRYATIGIIVLVLIACFTLGAYLSWEYFLGEMAAGDGNDGGIDNDPGESGNPSDPGDTDPADTGDDADPGDGEPRATHWLTGLPITTDQEALLRPVMVTIDNLAEVRPQTGLPAADVVFEVLTEGGITRLLAVYTSDSSQTVGPIRSARHYFLDFALVLDAFYVHCGWSPQAERDIASLPIDNLNEFYLSSFFFRDKSKRPPHTVHARISRLRDAAEALNYRATLTPEKAAEIAPWDFDPEAGSTQAARIISVKYPGGEKNDVVFAYSDEGGEGPLYHRFINTKAHTDRDSGSQLTAANVVVMFVGTSAIAGDTEGRINMDLIGQGRAELFTGGTRQVVVWVKNSRTGPLTFLTQEGDRVKVRPGTTWVLVVPTGTPVQSVAD